MGKLEVNVVTPDGNVYYSDATFVVVKTPEGELGILPKHAPIIAPLSIDVVRVEHNENKDQTDWIAVNGGILEVRDDVITIVADSAERERDIDVPRAERAKRRAEELIQKAKEKSDVDELRRATVALHRALNRINVSKKV